jgi:hypothetical protein
MADDKPQSIFQIIPAIRAEAGALAATKSPQGGVPFPFRGIDGTINHLAPYLTKYGVVTVPKVLERTTTSREVGSKTVTQTDLLADFTFYAPDGSSITATTNGLAQDFADRSAAQAQSVAFRVALLQTFTLPTQQKEPEETGEEVIKGTAEEKAKVAQTTAASAKVDQVADLQGQIKAVIANPDSPYTGDVINALGNQISGGKVPAVWMKQVTVLKAILDKVAKGEVA